MRINSNSKKKIGELTTNRRATLKICDLMVCFILIILRAEKRLISHLEKFEDLMCSDWAFEMDDGRKVNLNGMRNIIVNLNGDYCKFPSNFQKI
jgi:hypothetical protein